MTNTAHERRPQQRGPLLARADPSNRSPKDGIGEGGSTDSKAPSRKPPQHDGRRRKRPPIRSSGYGGGSPSPAVEIGRRRPRSLPASPAGSVAGGVRGGPTSCRLRHGDGSVFASGGGAARPWNFKKSEGTGAKPTAQSAASRKFHPARSRTPSPAPGDEGSGGSVRPGPAAAKQLRRPDGGSAARGPRHPSSGDGARRRRPSPREDCGGIDDDDDDDEPTAVKEARRLSSLFRGRAAAPRTRPASLGPSSPLARTNGRNGTPVPRSGVSGGGFSGGRGLPAVAAPAIAASSPLSATKLFRATGAYGAVVSARTPPRRSGGDAAGVRRLPSEPRRGDAGRRESRERSQGREEDPGIAAGIEGGPRAELAEARRVLERTTSEKSTLENELQNEKDETASLKERMRRSLGEHDRRRTEAETITTELDGAKEELGRMQRAHAEHAIAMALLESKLGDCNAQKEAALTSLAEVESSKDEDVREAESKGAARMEEESSRMRGQNAALLNENKVRRTREEKVCRLMGVDVGSSDEIATGHSYRSDANDDDDGGVGATDSFLSSIKHRLEEFQKDRRLMEELAGDLEGCGTELERVKANHQVALETIAAGAAGALDAAARRRAAEDRAAAAEGRLTACRDELRASGAVAASLREEVARLGEDAARRDGEGAERVALEAQLDAQVREHARVEGRLRDELGDAGRALEEGARLREEESGRRDAEAVRTGETIAALEAHQLSLKESLSEQRCVLDASKEEEIGRLRGDIANLESRLRSECERMESAGAASEARVRELEEVIRKGRAERKRMHNIIQELRGNVRVFARIRPFVPNDGKQGKEDSATTPSVSHVGDSTVTVTKRNDPGQKHKFSFDRVFAPSAGQETVYGEVSEFVQSALDGYSVTLFSYGQTGSGKTHTMEGTGAGVMRGLIPRSIEQIGAHEVQLKNDGWEFSMELSFLEIYNESVRDLLRDDSKEEGKHEIKVGGDGRRTVTNLTVKCIDPNDRGAVEAVLALAAKHRSTASTDMNASSSRSHSVFTLHLNAKHEGRNQRLRGTLNLVDLAGSERLDRSNAEGQQAKETVAINKSLSSLADVFYAIGQKQSHVPFRHSKLTYLLQPSLSGDGKTLMVVNISPTEASVQESLCSLRFASKVNKCELGKAKRMIEEVKNEKGAVNKCELGKAKRMIEEVKNEKGATHNKRGNTSGKGTGAVGRNVKRKT